MGFLATRCKPRTNTWRRCVRRRGRSGERNRRIEALRAVAVIVDAAKTTRRLRSDPGPYVRPCEVSGRIRRDNRASRNKNAPHHSSLLLFVNGCSASRVAFGVGAFGRRRHSLAVLRDDRSTRYLIFAASLFRFKREVVGIYLFHGDGIPRCSSGRVLLAIVFISAAVIDGSTVL